MSRSRLIYVPGVPFSVEALMPRAALAAVAGGLVERGHKTRVLDYGTLSALSRFGTPGFRAAARDCRCRLQGGREHLPAGLSGWLYSRRYDGLFQESLRRWWWGIAQEAAGSGPLDFVVFLAEDRRSFLGACETARFFRERCPGVPVLLAGCYVRQCGGVLLSSTGLFDGACLGDVEWTIPELADRIETGSSWGAVPGLMTYAGGVAAAPSRQMQTELDFLPRPCFSAEVYPALKSDKLRYFTVEFSRGRHHFGHGDPVAPWCASRVRSKSAGRLCEELGAVMAEWGTGVFHVAGSSAAAAELKNMAREVAGRGFSIRYSSCLEVASAEEGALEALAGSGCCSLGLRVHSGSQYNLDGFFGADFTVSEAERALRGSRGAGMFTVAHLTCPIPKDDYHTRAESVRLLDRTRPESVVVSPVRVYPGSRWQARSSWFGLRIDPVAYGGWLAGTGPRARWFESEGSGPCRIEGRNCAKERGERGRLLEEVTALGIGVGVTEVEGLVARLSSGGAEEGFCGRLRQAFSTFDVAEVAQVVSDFNCSAAIPRSAVHFRRFRPVLEAVGN